MAVKVTSLSDKTQFRTIGAEIEALLKTYAEERGITITYHGGTLGVSSADMKLHMTILRSDGKSPEALDFEKYASTFGFEASDLNRTFVSRRTMYKIVGLNLRSRTTPILCDGVVNGKTYRFPEDTVLHALGRKTALQKRLEGDAAAELRFESTHS